MIRRDYLLRMIEEFIQMLSRIKSLKREQLWREAAVSVEEEFHKLIESGGVTAARLSDTELLAKLIQGEPTQAVREKMLILTALFKEAGDLAVAQDRPQDGCLLYIKGLHLLLELLAQEDAFEYPDFVPRLDAFTAALQDSRLPLQTQARLMQYYERVGEFAKAEDCLFAMLETEPDDSGLLEFGMAFYDRLGRQSDAALVAGNLPRAELEAGLLELKNKSRDLPPAGLMPGYSRR